MNNLKNEMGEAMNKHLAFIFKVIVLDRCSSRLLIYELEENVSNVEVNGTEYAKWRAFLKFLQESNLIKRLPYPKAP